LPRIRLLETRSEARSVLVLMFRPCIHNHLYTHPADMILFIPSLALAYIVLLQPSSTAPLLSKPFEFGPHITTDFPDPSILRVGDIWYAFAGQSLYDYTSTHIQVATSTNFKTWTLHPGIDMLPNLPSWVDVSKNHVWAPDINHLACAPKPHSALVL
jgi:hypothetical protein